MALADVGHTTRVEERTERRLLGAELLVVLMVFPLPYISSALYALLYRIDTGLDARSVSSYFPHDHFAGLLVAIVPRIAMLAGAALVCYLLTRSGEGTTAIGLDRYRVRRDLALVLPVWALVQVVPMF